MSRLRSVWVFENVKKVILLSNKKRSVISLSLSQVLFSLGSFSKELNIKQKC